MPSLHQTLDIERAVNLLKAFDWDLQDQKVSGTDVKLTFRKAIPGEEESESETKEAG